jgi:hypothetical protein
MNGMFGMIDLPFQGVCLMRGIKTMHLNACIIMESRDGDPGIRDGDQKPRALPRAELSWAFSPEYWGRAA